MSGVSGSHRLAVIRPERGMEVRPQCSVSDSAFLNSPMIRAEPWITPLCQHLGTNRFFDERSATRCAHRDSKTVMQPVSDNVLAFNHLSFETLRVQGPSEQIFMGLRILSLRSALSTSANIEPLKGEYR